MLKGISPLLSPHLLAILCEMGHGDRIVLADSHFPGHSLNDRVIRADGLKIKDLLRAILPLFELDTFVESAVIMMEPVPGDFADPSVKRGYEEVMAELLPHQKLTIAMEPRFEFYESAREAYAVVMTGDTAKYGNVILAKGVTPA